jgi:hypothetical protein
MRKKILLPILILLICISGCTDSFEYTLNIRIYNNSDNQEDISITIRNSSNLEIFNETIILHSNQMKKVSEITNDIGVYSIYISMNQNRTIINNDINVGKDYGPVSIEIFNNEIKIFQQQN